MIKFETFARNPGLLDAYLNKRAARLHQLTTTGATEGTNLVIVIIVVVVVGRETQSRNSESFDSNNSNIISSSNNTNIFKRYRSLD